MLCRDAQSDQPAEFISGLQRLLPAECWGNTGPGPLRKRSGSDAESWQEPRMFWGVRLASSSQLQAFIVLTMRPVASGVWLAKAAKGPGCSSQVGWLFPGVSPSKGLSRGPLGGISSVTVGWP